MPINSSKFMQRGSWIKPRSSDSSSVSRSSWIAVNRKSGGGLEVGRSMSISSRKALVESQAELDKAIFDPSLGCPLGSYEDATNELVGGKALSCWQMMRHGIPIPSAFIIPTYVYSMHIKAADAVDLINEVYSSDLSDPNALAEATTKFVEIAKRIVETPINEEVVCNLESFVSSFGSTVEFSVRSSGSAEDMASKSFAGQYDTFLYKKEIEEICKSIKLCWASMFKSHILDYISKQGGQDPEFFQQIKSKPPKMGVLVMRMVNAQSAGVCFSQNLWGAKNEVMIEAVFGQGEGLVSGELTPDRFVVDKNSCKLCYQDISKQTHKFIRSKNEEGVEKVELGQVSSGPVLDSAALKQITVMARQLEDFYNTPQDIEWAMDAGGVLHILQSRPITTTSKTASLTFLPPGEGFWTFDPTHFPLPLTPWMQEVYSFKYFTERSRRAGCLINDIKFRFVHEYCFNQPELCPPTPALERAAQAYWSKKLYEDDYREFCDFFRPKCEELQNELRSVNPASLGHNSLVEHVVRCYDLAREFWRLHHTYTMPAMIVIGDYMNRMGALCNKDVFETLALLEGASPESRGVLNQEDPLISEMYELLRESNIAMGLLQVEGSQASWALDCLFHMPDRLGEVMREVRHIYGWRLAGSYDLTTSSLIETPDFFLKTLYMGTQEDPLALLKAEEKVRKTADEWKSQVPEDKHEEFEEVLELGRKFFRLRDERGLCTDLLGVGLCRRGILEAGRRLTDQGVIYEAEHLCVARKHEAVALLRGDFSLLSDSKNIRAGPLEVPTPNELQRRYNYIFNANPNLVPRALGTPPPPADPMQLPDGIRRTMAAIDTGLLRGIWAEAEQEEAIMEDSNVVKGLSASAAGVVEGPCCLVTNEGELRKVKKGDILITYSCSASFNIVLALCSGIVTDYGGMLSHAAIVAREYGIPAVVGTQLATKKFKDGDIVRIDCGRSSVTSVKAS